MPIISMDYQRNTKLQGIYTKKACEVKSIQKIRNKQH